MIRRFFCYSLIAGALAVPSAHAQDPAATIKTAEYALGMIRGIKGAAILEGARGRERADIEALAGLLVALGQFAVANSGRFRALDLNPIMVGSSGVVAVDIAIEPIAPRQDISNAAE